LAIQIQYLDKGLIGYKAASYGEWCPYTNLTTADDSRDWSGLNVSLNPGLAKGYRTDYLAPSSGNGIAYRHEVHLLQKVQLVVCDDPQAW
jgi:hypothetical protein